MLFTIRPSLAFAKLNRSLRPALLLVMLVVAGGVGWKAFDALISSSEEVIAPSDTQALLPVNAVQATSGLAQAWTFEQGAVWPVNRQVLNFRANGLITYLADVEGVSLKEGDFVAAGELLATIDDRRQLSAIATAEAEVAVSMNQGAQSEATLMQAQANLEKANADVQLAQTELQRYQTLFEQGAVSASDRDRYQNQVDQAIAAAKTAQQDVFSAEASTRSAKSTVSSSRSRLSQNAIDLEDTQLISPIDGIVAYINIREGEYWNTQYFNSSSAQSAIETAPIVVMDLQSFEVELEVKSSAADDIRPGQRAYVVLEKDISAAQASGATSQDLLSLAQQQGSAGRVFSVSPSQTPDGRGTEVTIRDFEQVRNLQVGGRAYVWIEIEQKNNAVMVPLGTLLPREGEFYAFVVNEVTGRVQRRRVTKGIEGLSEVEILSGIQPGEWVVSEGQNRLVEGTPVEIVNQGSVTSQDISSQFRSPQEAP
ncbi:MAG: multidrug transporter [Cyanobacteria bacterium J06627_28]